MAAKKKSGRPRSRRDEADGADPPSLVPDPASRLSADVASLNRPDGRPFFPIVGIGASAGGLDAFKRFFGAMPADAGMAFVLVPHLDPKHDSLMVELMGRQTHMPVVEAADGQLVEANHLYVIPPNKFLEIEGERLRLTVLPDPRGRQTALDTFFRSLAEGQRERSIGIVLSGTGSHGTPGIKEIKLAGGMVMVQEPGSADFDQMPRSAIDTGLVDFVLPPEQMPEALINYIRQPYVSSREADESSPELLNRVLALVKARTRYDFRPYRPNMLLRRIQRRMGLAQVEEMSAYLELLRTNPDEVSALYRDLLIGVTGFFRDPEAFQILEQRVIPELVARNDGNGPLRIWVAACSSGEEAYTVAMLLFEGITAAKSATEFQIFASDIDEAALSVARRGTYAESGMGDVSAERLRRFFTKNDDQTYQVSKRLRDTIVFAPQNLIGDAPFSRINLITCRNVLIYLEPEVQKRLISLFHFALKEDGCLMLGPSETVGRHAKLFEVLSTRWRVYKRIGPVRRRPVDLPTDTRAAALMPVLDVEARTRNPPGLAELMQKQLFAEFAPASVLFGRDLEVLCFQGPTSDYLEFPSGEPTRDLLALARQGLRTRLRALIARAIQTGEAVSDFVPRVKRHGRYFACRVTVKPFRELKKQSDLFLAIFEDRPEVAGTQVRPGETVHDSALIGQLESELRSMREDLQGTIEELESSNEEMKASNEEMMSMNEELQSVNEELETSKEELQSTNEELITVNNQLNQKIVELDAANNDISNLLNSTDIPTLFLTTDFRVRRFTPSAVKLFRLLATDLGRPIEDFTRNFTSDRLLDDCRTMLETRRAVEREVRAETGEYYGRRVLPYVTADHLIEGVVITFVDLTERKRAADYVNEARLYAEGIVATVREPLVVLDASLSVRSANPSFYRAIELPPGDVLERPLLSLESLSGDKTALKSRFDLLLAANTEIFDFELSLPRVAAGPRTMLLNARKIPSLDEGPSLILVAMEDVTDRKRAEAEFKAFHLTLEDRVSVRTAEAESRARELVESERALRESEARLRAIVTTAADAIVTIDGAGLIESCNLATERMFDYPTSAMVGQKIEVLIPWFDFEGNRDGLAHYLSIGDNPIHTLGREMTGRRRDGSTFPIDLALSELHEGSRRLYTGIIHDISERKALQQELLSIAEAEQRRIGQDLHDDIGQELTGLTMKAETLSEIVTELQIPERDLAADIVTGLDRTRGKVRALSRGMVPVEIDANGLAAALEELTARSGHVHHVACVFDCPDPSVEIDPRQATQLYHIAQEAITNALKHSQARRIEVALDARTSEIRLAVSDDGIGLADELARSDGMGLRIMSYRAGLIQGKLEIRRGERGGTLVSCLVAKVADHGTNLSRGQ